MLRKRLYRSCLATPGKTAELISRIKSKHIVFQVGNTRFDARTLTNVVIDEVAGSDNFQFTRAHGPGYQSSLVKQALTFRADLEGDEGDAITVTYVGHTPAAKAAKVIQDITYEAALAGVAGNLISLEYLAHTPAVAASKVIQDITYTAATAGVAGNSISVEYTDTAEAGAEAATVDGNAISVAIKSGVSTATQVKAAIDGSVPALALVSAAITGTAGTAQVTAAPALLLLGANGIGLAGAEIVTVVDNAISVKLQSGVSTATQVKAAIDASEDALELITATITGTAGTAQVSAAAAFLLLGAAAIGLAGFEVVTVVSNAIEVRLQSGVSTANQVLAKLLLSAPAMALVDVTLTGTGSAAQNTSGGTTLAGGEDAPMIEKYDLSDVMSIRRLRSRKWLIRFKSSADRA